MANSPIFLTLAPAALLGLSCLLIDSAGAQSAATAVVSPYSNSTNKPQVRSPASAPTAARIRPVVSRALRPADRKESNQAIDAALAKFSARNANNPRIQTALDDAAASVKRNPAAFVDANGTPHFAALADLVKQKFSSAGTIVVPSIRAQNGDDTTTISGNLDDEDIMALCFIVMMDAAKSAQEDLKSVMQGVQAINKQKDGWRKASDTINRLEAQCVGKTDDCGASRADKNTISVVLTRKGAAQTGAPVTPRDVDAAKEAVKNRLDSLSEMGETESLRLQMAMDRVSKFMSALSNIEKKTSDTDSAIIQNIK